MSHERTRLIGVVALVYLLFSSLAFNARASDFEPIQLPQTATEPGVVIYRARSARSAPIAVLLHGMCGEPQRLCAWFAEAITRSEHLICPRADAPCAGGGVSWSSRGLETRVEAAIERARSALGPAMDLRRPRTLIGYSLGALRAVELAETSPETYERLMLIGARVNLDPARFRAARNPRVLLAAGRWDMMYGAMQNEARRLTRAGFTARFWDLGQMGHPLSPTLPAILPLGLDWLFEDGVASPSRPQPALQ
ncbi:MAG TPA: hypothetical protein VFQ61_03965 [Polyangiaceae bacterium]|nr:hypothetical protein [Polyangiaceae bacterium]